MSTMNVFTNEQNNMHQVKIYFQTFMMNPKGSVFEKVYFTKNARYLTTESVQGTS